MRYSVKFLILAVVLLALGPAAASAQEKRLTVDDIYDPVKKVDFSGTPVSPRWLKDGVSYLQTNAPDSGKPRIQKVNALTGEAVPFFDAAKMEAAFAAVPGVSAADAKRAANQGVYQMNPAQTAFLVNLANDLFYYEIGGDKAVRLTNDKEEEVGETFSPARSRPSARRG